MAELDAVVAAARRLSIEPRTRRWVHLSLCVLDAVFSIGARYSTTSRTCRRYAEKRSLAALVPTGTAPDDEQPLDAFLADVEGLGPEMFAGSVLANRQLTSPRRGVLKAEAAYEYARILVDGGVRTSADVPALFADIERLTALEGRLRTVPGNGAADVRLGYLWMLLGDDTVIKPDRMVLTWLADLLDRKPTAAEARDLLAEVAAVLGCTPWELDHAIWSVQRRSPRRVVRSDDGVTRRYRAAQGRWREDVLGLPSGASGDPDVVGPMDSMLPAEHDGVTAEDAGWNLMSDAAVAYARERLPRVREAGGLVEAHRLHRDLLSGQPLAFSLVGELRAHPDAALALLSELSGVKLTGFDTLGPTTDPHLLDGLQAEWTPYPGEHLAERGGFDIAAMARTTEDIRLLVTIEVKYTDTFSRVPLDPQRYQGVLERVRLQPDVAAALVARGRSQFLRSVLLTAEVHADGQVDDVLAVVLSRDDDREAEAAVADVGAAVPGVPTAWWGLGALLEAAARHDELADWADAVAARYLPDEALPRAEPLPVPRE